MSTKVGFLFIIFAVIHVQAMLKSFFAETVEVPVTTMDGNAPIPENTKKPHGTTKIKKDTNAKEIWDLVAKRYSNPSSQGMYIHLSDVLVDSQLMTYAINLKTPGTRKIQITPETTMLIEYI